MKNRMQSLVRQYLAYRRKLGFRLRQAGGSLAHFSRFADRTAPGQPLTVALALRWTHTLDDIHPSTRTAYLRAIRCFARFCVAIDPRTELLPTRLIGPNYIRRAPHIYSADQVRLLMRRAVRLTPTIHSPLRPQTFETMIGLVATTGIRLGEMLRLRSDDFDAAAGTLRVPQAKFSPERVLPLHPSTVCALVRYEAQRRRRCPCSERFFAGPCGRPVPVRTADKQFRELAHGIVANGARPVVRWTDFRHSFATHWVATWSRTRAPVGHHLLLLRRYLGHRSFECTWWYVSADPGALKAASQRFFRHHHTPP